MTRLIAIFLTCSCLVMASEHAVHWSDLERTIAGKVIVISLSDGTRVKGNAVKVETDSVVVQTRNGRQSVPRSAVRQVHVRRQGGFKWRIIGGAVGAGVGAAIAIPVLAETHNEGSGRYDGAAVGLVGGLAALGYLTGWSADRGGEVITILPD